MNTTRTVMELHNQLIRGASVAYVRKRYGRPILVYHWKHVILVMDAQMIMIGKTIVLDAQFGEPDEMEPKFFMLVGQLCSETDTGRHFRRSDIYHGEYKTNRRVRNVCAKLPMDHLAEFIMMSNQNLRKDFQKDGYNTVRRK